MSHLPRTIVSSSLADLLRLHPKQRIELENILFQRIHDVHESVRIEALKSAARAVDLVSNKTLHRVLGRLQDKSDNVRKEAFVQIIALCTNVGPLSKQAKTNRPIGRNDSSRDFNQVSTDLLDHDDIEDVNSERKPKGISEDEEDEIQPVKRLFDSDDAEKESTEKAAMIPSNDDAFDHVGHIL